MVTSVHKRGFDCQPYQVNMAATTSETNSSRYPSEKSVKEALDMLKPPGILSKAYNQFQLKRYQVLQCMLRGNVYSSFILKQFKTIQSSSKQTESRVDETFLTLELFQSQTELTKMGDYPGSGYKMSSYGLKTYNPQETVGQWTQCCKVETRVAVPSLSSSVIGHPQRNPLEFPDRQHVRVEICKKDFLRLGGTNIGDTD
ncbi:unnamed protein product [Porites lobata]|uniref:Uncharacterized protein n=1 Tax=Porites lobata TaxID=104759 RepID=A0ABN8PK50_9CNID|nr:unnamed protein product [Porites lobata]